VRLGIDAQYFVFTATDEAEQIARRLAAETSQLPIVFLTLDGDAARILATLRRLGVGGPFLGGDALGDESFSGRLAALPEEHQQRGYFTDGLYGLSPMILDSANADTLAFAARFRVRFSRDPVWFNAAGYDAARLAVATLRAVAVGASPTADPHARRAAVLH
jgi:branched-chain amino acid transport system substrate-binding protein